VKLTRSSAFDESLDWDDPGDPSPWSPAEWMEFKLKFNRLLERLRVELGKEWAITDELHLT